MSEIKENNVMDEKNIENSDQENAIPFAEDIIVFEDLNCDNIDKLIEVGHKCPYFLSCYSPGCLIMWKELFKPAFTLVGGCVVIKIFNNDKECFLFPYTYLEDGDINAALFAMERYATKNALSYSILAVERSTLSYITSRYKSFSVLSSRNESDYIYLTEDLKNFAGRKYSGQRNHINKFKKLYPQAIFKELSESDEDKEKLEKFWSRYEVSLNSKPESAKIEFDIAKTMFSRPCVRTSHKACVEVDGEIIAVSFGEVFSDMLIIHIEKALENYAGVYPYMVTLFANAYGDSVKYINRQDDAGSRGLRISKTQYHPFKIEENFSVEINTVLSNMSIVPSISTERLIIDSMTEDDIDSYNKLCLDDDNNKLWGYDYHKYLHGELQRDYFYNIVKNDIKNGSALSLAIRYNGTFIGEVILNEFNFRGSADLGIRILPEFTHRGFAKEAFCGVCDFALYNMGLSAVTAYCFKENLSSYKMLSSCMKQISEDYKYYYFIKTL